MAHKLHSGPSKPAHAIRDIRHLHRLVTETSLFVSLLPGLYPAALLPRPAPGDFQLKGKTQKRADHHDQGKHGQVLESWGDGNCSDDVPRNKQFEPKENGTAQVLAVCAVAVQLWRGGKKEGSHGSDKNAADNNQNSCGIDRHADFFNGGLECVNEAGLYHVRFSRTEQKKRALKSNHEAPDTTFRDIKQRGASTQSR
jgi:hypothetical protein